MVSVQLVAGGVVFALFKWGPLGDKATIDSTTVAGSFDTIAELSAEEYNLTNVSKYNEEGREFAGWNIPFTGKDFLLTYNAAVKAGVKDMSDIDVSCDEGAIYCGLVRAKGGSYLNPHRSGLHHCLRSVHEPIQPM